MEYLLADSRRYIIRFALRFDMGLSRSLVQAQRDIGGH